MNLRPAFLAATLLLAGCSGVKHDPSLRAVLSSKPVVVPAPAGAKDVHLAGGAKLCASWVAGTRFESVAFDGTTWSTPVAIAEDVDPAARNGREPSISRAGSGALVARWFATAAGTTRAHVRTSGDDGATWSDAVALDPSVGTGTLAFAWFDGDLPDSVTVAKNPSSGYPPAAAFYVGASVGGKAEPPLEAGECNLNTSLSAVRSENVRIVAFRDHAEVCARGFELDRSKKRDAPLFQYSQPGDGPILAARGASVAAVWIESKPQTVHVAVSGSNGRHMFGWGVWLKNQPGAKQPHAVFDKDGTLIGAWMSEKGLALIRLAPEKAAGNVWTSPLPDAELHWAGVVGDAPWLAWTQGKSGRWLAAPLAEANPIAPLPAE